jgi:hypothetical protein
MSRTLRRGIQVLIAAAVLSGATVALTSDQAAFAANQPGWLNPSAGCGWYAVDGPGGVQYRRTTATLPAVTGTTSNWQYVMLSVDYEHYENSQWVSRPKTYWFYTTARYGQVTRTWTSSDTGQSGLTAWDDPVGLDGYVDSDGNNPFVGVKVTAWWTNAGQITGIASEWETTPLDPVYGKYICNMGDAYR